MVEIVPAEERDIRAVAYQMRLMDQLEVYLSHRHEPGEALFHAEQSSLWTRAARDRRGVFAVFGLAESKDDPGLASPWMLGTDRVKEHATAMIRLGREWLADMLATHERLANYVYSGNMDSRRWLERIGFTIEPEPTPYGTFLTDFHLFWARR